MHKYMSSLKQFPQIKEMLTTKTHPNYRTTSDLYSLVGLGGEKFGNIVEISRICIKKIIFFGNQQKCVHKGYTKMNMVLVFGKSIKS